MSGSKNLNKIHQASRYYTFWCKKAHVGFEQLDVTFKQQKMS